MPLRLVARWGDYGAQVGGWVGTRHKRDVAQAGGMQWAEGGSERLDGGALDRLKAGQAQAGGASCMQWRQVGQMLYTWSSLRHAHRAHECAARCVPAGPQAASVGAMAIQELQLLPFGTVRAVYPESSTSSSSPLGVNLLSNALLRGDAWRAINSTVGAASWAMSRTGEGTLIQRQYCLLAERGPGVRAFMCLQHMLQSML